MATRILLLRHAQSEWNAAGRWQGWADPPLSPEGESAVAAAAGSPCFDGVDAAVASDLQRARRTAEVLAARRAWPAVRTFRGLRERGAGQWTGLTRTAIERGWPGALEHPVARIPGGESPAAVTARAVATLFRIAEGWP
ncbi:MAG TPA: histidine phosphatase family protein, partial [Acidimicrobiales bacterium]